LLLTQYYCGIKVVIMWVPFSCGESG